MGRVAARHNFKVLLHEKPFAGVNGSGKHNNWSISTDTGVNLLSPGKTPMSNLQFLTFFINTIKAVHEHEALLRAAIASASNNQANCGNPMTVLNTIVAKQLKDFKKEVDVLVKKNDLKKDEAIFNVLREYIKSSRPILFEGNGYGEAWEKEAKKRGLSNNRTTPEALKAKISKKAIALFEGMGVMSKIETEARYEIEVEAYIKHIQIESRVLGDIARNHIVPTAVKYQNILVENVRGLKEIFEEKYKDVSKEQINLIEEISGHIAGINANVTKMIDQRKNANNMDNLENKAHAYCNQVMPLFDDIRYHCDKLELLVDDEIWPLTKYREMLFTR